MRTIKNVTLASNKSGNKLFVQRGSAGSYQEDFSPDSMDKVIKKTVGVLGNRTGNTSDEVSDVKSPLSIKRNDITQLKKEARTRLDTIDPYSSEAVELGSILNGSDTTTVLDTHNRAVETADEIPAMGSNAGGLSGNLPSSTSVTDVVVRGMLINVIDDIIYDKNPYRSNIALNRILRDMFYHDSTTGSAVNLLSTLPFSEFSLSGLKDEKMTSVFVDSLESMKINSLLPNMSIDYLVVGSAIVSLTYDEKIKRFTGSFPHNIDFAHFIQVPSYGIDPIIKVRLEPHIAGALNNPTIRDKYLNYIPKQIVEFYSQGGANGKGGGEGFELDPKTSIFIARNGTLRDFRGISLLKRAVPAWLYEKALIKGTLDQSYKRQRAIMHVTAGDGEEWIPLAEEMQAISNMFLAADLDPLGAIVVTRNGVNVNEVRQGQDFWRWDQNFDMIERIKLRSIGISESFVSGDACLSGDTLIPTEKGLLRIDEICPDGKEDGHFHPLDLIIEGRYGKQKASGWLYNGIKYVFEITTDIGNNIKATANHKVLILRPNLDQDWVRVDELKLGDTMLSPDANFDYRRTAITSIEKLKDPVKVYDISMGNGEPAFVANGLIVHNSYNSLEQTISVFMDQIRAYRNQFTSEIFYEKIFPMISEANGITKQRYGVKRGTEIASYGSSTAYRDEDNNIVASIGNSYPQVREFAAGSSANIDIRNFVVPEVLWHKRLMPEADEAYINMLGALHEKGLPITIRQWAAAGGMNLDNLMEDLNEDLRIREKIVDYRKAITDAMKAAGMGDEENDPGNSSQAFGEFASSRSSLERAVDQLVSEKFNIGSVRKKALLSYGDPEHPNAQFSDRDSKGNRRVMTKQGRDIMANRFTKNLAKAAAEMAKQENARIKDENWQTDQRINKKKYYHGK